MSDVELSSGEPGQIRLAVMPAGDVGCPLKVHDGPLAWPASCLGRRFPPEGAAAA